MVTEQQTQRLIFRPQQGPQWEFLSNKSNICLYGGAAGGGKTFALLLEALWHHATPGFDAVIFRKNATQIRNAGGLWAESEKLFTHFKGEPRQSTLEWQFPCGAKIKFAHLDQEIDKYSWQGSQICCEETTLIKVKKSLIPLNEICVGDSVQTLEGLQNVLRKGQRRLESCVRVQNDNGIDQIHTYTHKILTSKGWISYLDVCKFCESLQLLIFCTIEYYFCSRYAKCFQQKFEEFRQLLDNQFLDLLTKLPVYEAILDRLILQDFFFCKVAQDQEIDCESSAYNSQVPLQQLSSLLMQELQKLSFLLKQDIFSLVQVDYEAFDAQIESLFQDCLYDYSKGFHLYDAHIQKIKDNDLVFSPLLNGVVVQNQIDSLYDEKGTTQKCTYHTLHYVHPYTGQRQILESDQINFQTLKFSPVGKKWVVDITIANTSHYITKSGLVNKNCLIGFDELTHFSWGQFVYMMSRNRSMCGIRPYIRATTNPDPDSWVRRFIDWYINPDTGYAIPERSGKIRWFIVIDDETIWADSKQELIDKYPISLPKSFSFIASSVFDNKILLEKDPGYLANLQALPRYEREQLLYGNWNIRPTAGMFFQRQNFEIVPAIPRDCTFVRYWDRAATKKTENNDPDYTVGIKLARDSKGIFYVCDMVRLQESPLQVQNAIKNTASQDGYYCRIGLEQDPGQAGISEVDLLIRMLAGYTATAHRVTSDKITRASPVSAQGEAGNIKVLKGHWNENFFKEIENFPDGLHDDIVDALSGAFLMHTESSYDINALIR